MNLVAQFALVVQTIVLAMEWVDDPVYITRAASIVAHAASLPEEAIPRGPLPNSVDPAAAYNFVAWYLETGKRPEWLP